MLFRSDCYTGNGLAYRGTRSRTKSGASCLPWNSVFLTSKIYTAWKSNAQALGLGTHNHCRCASWTAGACPRGGRGGGRSGNSHVKGTWVGGNGCYGRTHIPS